MQTVQHVVVVTDSAKINGGSTKVALTSAMELARRGLAVTVFTAVGPIDPQLLRCEGLRVICLGQHDILTDPKRARAVVQGMWNRRAAEAMRAVLSQLDARTTVVHVHGWTKALSSSVLHVAAEMRFPLVMTLHDYFAACPTGTFFNHRSQSICTIKPMGGRCVTTNCDPRSRLQKLWRVARQTVQAKFARMPRRIDHFITISSLSEAVIRPHVEHRTASFYRVGNPIDAQISLPAKPATQRRFTYLGRLSREKGVSLFAEATAIAEVEAQTIGAGDCRDELARINPRLHMHGWLDHEEILRELRSSRALIFPSLCYETFGLTVLEGAAIGIPSVVPDTSAAADLVRDGVTGLIFKSGDVHDLVAKIRLLAEDDALVARLGAAAYTEFWSAPPTLAHHVDSLSPVYERVLGGRAS